MPPPLQLLTKTLRRAPFVIFSKTAPLTLPQYDVDKDFCYFFFNDAMKHFSGICPTFLTSGNRNAKTDFPVDYQRYFEDDAIVCKKFLHPEIKEITEPWKTPALRTILETRKTTMTTHKDGKKYMLGCFGPHDDVEMGICEFRARSLPPALDHDFDHIPSDWYREAFIRLPIATILIEGDTRKVISRNFLAQQRVKLEPEKVASLLDQVDALPDYDSYEFGNVEIIKKFTSDRVWFWRPDITDRNIIAVSLRPQNKNGYGVVTCDSN